MPNHALVQLPGDALIEHTGAACTHQLHALLGISSDKESLSTVLLSPTPPTPETRDTDAEVAMEVYSKFTDIEGSAAQPPVPPASCSSCRRTFMLTLATLMALGAGVFIGFAARDSQLRSSVPASPPSPATQPRAPLASFSASLVANGYAVDSVLYGPVWASVAGTGILSQSPRPRFIAV
jgi:hypothetical protein